MRWMVQQETGIWRSSSGSIAIDRRAAQVEQLFKLGVAIMSASSGGSKITTRNLFCLASSLSLNSRFCA